MVFRFCSVRSCIKTQLEVFGFTSSKVECIVFPHLYKQGVAKVPSAFSTAFVLENIALTWLGVE